MIKSKKTFEANIISFPHTTHITKMPLKIPSFKRKSLHNQHATCRKQLGKLLFIVLNLLKNSMFSFLQGFIDFI